MHACCIVAVGAVAQLSDHLQLKQCRRPWIRFPVHARLPRYFTSLLAGLITNVDGMKDLTVVL